MPHLKIAMVGTFPPTQCGIATFTADLCSAIRESKPSAEVDVFVIKEHSNTHYSDAIRFEIAEQSQESYIEAAGIVNQENYDIVSIQHEYGIFGGLAGSFLLDFVWQVNAPIVTTLHTVLDQPSLTQKLVLEALLDRSERIVVMSEKAVDLLISVHGIDRSKIDVIPHGIPVIPKNAVHKFRLGIPTDSPMILTFGLLSPDKGVQYVIEAMPEIIKDYPNATYAIVGATHPHIFASHGEEYRESLIKLAEDLGVKDNVKFINEFLPVEDLIGYLSAMDIYVTPYLKPNQITSGTLAYAVGAGKAVISTPYWYAEELLADGTGVLVPFRDSSKIAEAVIEIEKNPIARREMGEKAAQLGNTMLWSEVGRRYTESIELAVEKIENANRQTRESRRTVTPEIDKLSSLNTFHLREMSDDTGILQHATHSIPLRSEGYCVDDNARALLFTALVENFDGLPEDLDLYQSCYLSFVLEAFNSDRGRFRNFMDYQRNWLEREGSDDSHGRAVWALGTLIHKCTNKNRREVAMKLFKDSLPAFDNISSPRTWAYGILGADEYLHVFPHDLEVRVFMEKLANRLLDQYELCRDGDWNWFEESLSYANARLPQALMLAGHTLINDRMLRAGLESIEWLRLIQTNKEGQFSPIGSNQCFLKGKIRDEFDQQPIEAAASVSCYLSAWKVTGKSTWLAEAHRAYNWFLGANSIGIALYDEKNGGCYDGLHPDRLNKNQGAESTLSFLCAKTEMRTALFPSKTEAAKKTPYASK
ncbi:MAG: glycosyltransferase family 4 protein [Fimbriimonadaceae bacterium]